MADYTGIAASVYKSRRNRAILPSGESVQTKTSPVRMSLSIKYGGTCSRELLSGEKQSIWYGCDAGEKTISVWVKPPIVGTCALELLNDAGNVIQTAYNTASGAWEQISITFTAEKKVYVIRLVNYGKASGDIRAYFDNLE